MEPAPHVFHLSEDTKNYLQREFSKLDTDKKGYVTSDVLHNCLESVGVHVLNEDLKLIKKMFDSNGDGHLTVKELVDNIALIHAHSLRRDEIMKAFAVFDVDKKGYIRLPHMLKILTHNNFMDVQEARSYLNVLCQKYDKNFDGRFDYGEFIQMFMGEEMLSKNFGQTD